MKRFLAFLLTAAILVSCFVISIAADDEKHEIYAFRPCDGVEQNFFENEDADNKASWNGWCRFADAGNYLIYSYPALNLDKATKVTWTANVGQQLKLEVSQDKTNWTLVYACEDEFNEHGDRGLIYGLREFDLTDKLNKSGPKKIYLKISDSFNGDGWGGAVTIFDNVVLDIAYTGETAAPAGTIPFKTTIAKQTKDPGEYETPGTCINYSFKLDDPIDISGMTYLAFDIGFGYRTADGVDGRLDSNMVKAIREFCLELTSGGAPDQQENALMFSLDDFLKVDKVTYGFYTIQIPLSRINAQTNGGLTPTAFNFFRIFANSKVVVPEVQTMTEGNEADQVERGMEVYFTNFRFQDATYEPAPEVSEEGEHEMYTFIIDGTATNVTPCESEAPYFVESTAGWNGTQRFSDGNGHTIYKYTIKNYASVKKVTWEAATNAQLLLKVSQDGENWQEVYRYQRADDAPANDGLPRKVRTYDFTPFLDLTEVKEIWVSIEDAYTQDGWGGSIFKDDPCILDVLYEKLADDVVDGMEMKATEHTLPILGCNEAFDNWKLDKENQQAGSGCVTAFGVSRAPQYVWATPIDVSAFDTLEFELYVSDLAFFEYADLSKEAADRYSNAWIELSSSGECDKSEIAWNWQQVLAGIDGTPKAGWNHVALAFKDATASDGDTGPFDPTKLNFIRTFYVNPGANIKDAVEDIVIKLDTIAVTDRQAQLYAAAVEEASDCVAKIEALTYTSVELIKTEDDLTAAKKAYNSANNAYKRLSDEAKATLTEDQLNKLNACKAAIDAYVPAEEQSETQGNESETGGTTPGESETGSTTPGEDDKETKAEEKKGGCGSVVVGGAIVVLAVVSAAGAMIVRKKED
ncbi:MAG: hypothetical protein IJT60_02625 [Clostridia bacterium]|nr:hypothetical protein [Clostridia bacterium]